jgi:hypothetical protein
MADKPPKGKKPFLKKYGLKIIAPSVIVAIITIIISIKANTIATTQNMFEINNAIQLRTDAVLAIEYEISEYKMSDITDYKKEALQKRKLEEAVIMMLNTYEFACTLYLKNMVDKNIFKQYYCELINIYIKRYEDNIFNPSQPEAYSAIKKVHKEWLYE